MRFWPSRDLKEFDRELFAWKVHADPQQVVHVCRRRPPTLFFFSVTLGLELSDTKVCEP